MKAKEATNALIHSSLPFASQPCSHIEEQFSSNHRVPYTDQLLDILVYTPLQVQSESLVFPIDIRVLLYKMATTKWKQRK